MQPDCQLDIPAMSRPQLCSMGLMLPARWQDDVVHEDLTVRENLAYSAWLRSMVHMPTRAKGEVVDEVIQLLNLRHVQHSLVGSVEHRGIRCAVSWLGQPRSV